MGIRFRQVGNPVLVPRLISGLSVNQRYEGLPGALVVPASFYYINVHLCISELQVEHKPRRRDSQGAKRRENGLENFFNTDVGGAAIEEAFP